MPRHRGQDWITMFGSMLRRSNALKRYIRSRNDEGCMNMAFPLPELAELLLHDFEAFFWVKWFVSEAPSDAFTVLWWSIFITSEFLSHWTYTMWIYNADHLLWCNELWRFIVPSNEDSYLTLSQHQRRFNCNNNACGWFMCGVSIVWTVPMLS